MGSIHEKNAKKHNSAEIASKSFLAGAEGELFINFYRETVAVGKNLTI